MSAMTSTTTMEDLQSTKEYGNDDASDAREAMKLDSSSVTRAMASINLDSEDPTLSACSAPKLQVPMPQLSNGLVTFAYHRALLNRIKESKLREGSSYDIKLFTPTFVHDTLMLPGSLANLIGKVCYSTAESRLHHRR